MTIPAENEDAISINRAKTDSQNYSGIRALGVYTIFTASGAAGLIYQVIWARWLGLHLETRPFPYPLFLAVLCSDSPLAAGLSAGVCIL